MNVRVWGAVAVTGSQQACRPGEVCGWGPPEMGVRTGSMGCWAGGGGLARDVKGELSGMIKGPRNCCQRREKVKLKN